MRIDDVITALGGPEATAKLFGVGRTSISNWKTFRRFPEYLHWRVVKECRKRGIDYDPAATEIDVRNTTHGGTSKMGSSTMKTPIEGRDGKQTLNEYDEKVTEQDLAKTKGNSVSDTSTIVTTPTDDAEGAAA